MSSFNPTYRPLDIGRAEIRVLEIHTAETGSIVSCTTSTISLDETCTYSALPYIWGDAKITEMILLDGHTVAVTRNLECALRHVCKSGLEALPARELPKFRVWVDAICINQANSVERTQRIQPMRRICSSAEVVFAWVGPACHSLAFQAVNMIAYEKIERCDEIDPMAFVQLAWMQNYPVMCQNGEFSPGRPLLSDHWNSLSRFLLATYWERVWIF